MHQLAWNLTGTIREHRENLYEAIKVYEKILQMELKEKIGMLRDKLSALDGQQLKKDAFLAAVRKFMEMGTLTAPLLRELIDHIDVYETEGKGKDRTQHIVIHYRFVGYICPSYCLSVFLL